VLAYRQRITFDGETRASRGSTVNVKIMATRVEGNSRWPGWDRSRMVAGSLRQGNSGKIGPNAMVTGSRGTWSAASTR
jgi:hypothetical protein